jgi:hypothetical protein
VRRRREPGEQAEEWVAFGNSGQKLGRRYALTPQPMFRGSFAQAMEQTDQTCHRWTQGSGAFARLNVGGVHVPFSTDSSGQKMRNVRLKGSAGTGSQLLCIV